MNAVATKPRFKANAAPAAPTLQKRLVDIESRLALGRKQLMLASESAELTHAGDALDVLLLHVIETMLPDALLPLDARPITAEAMEAAYTGMFPSLAAIEGVLCLAVGGAIEPLVREAHKLLDAANNDMDFGDMPGALPKAAELKTDTARAVPLPITAETHDPYCVMMQARDVMLAAIGESAKPTDAHYGVSSLIDCAVDHVERAQAALQVKAFSGDLHDKASTELAGLLGVLRAVNTSEVNDALMYAVETLLMVAKAQIDADNTTNQKANAA